VTSVAPAAPPLLLVAEDSNSDRMILKEAFDDLGTIVRLRFVVHGEELLDYLLGRAAYASDQTALRPVLILMDINMPRMNGIEALREIRSDADLRMLPVIILSTSDNPKQIVEAYDHGVNAYMTKPGRFDELVDLLRSFSAFWLSAAQLPALASQAGGDAE